jgi:hypothetical protein
VTTIGSLNGLLVRASCVAGTVQVFVATTDSGGEMRSIAFDTFTADPETFNREEGFTPSDGDELVGTTDDTGEVEYAGPTSQRVSVSFMADDVSNPGGATCLVSGHMTGSA